MTNEQKKSYEEALRKLEKEGRLTPDEVVSAASKPGHPLHDYFEWDDSKAGHDWRVEQARRLIRSIRIEVTVETRTIEVPRYVRDPSVPIEHQGIISVDQLRKEPHTALDAIRAEVARVASCLERAQALAEAMGLRRHIAAISKDVEHLRQKVERKWKKEKAQSPS